MQNHSDLSSDSWSTADAMQNHSGLSADSWSTANLVTSGLMGLCFVVGVPGNIAVILFIVFHMKRDNFTVHLMLNLAAADILCLITLPGWIYSQLMDFDRTACKLFTTLVYWSTYSSLMTVTVLSVYRCLRIRRPQLLSRMTKRKEQVLLLTIWILALVFSCPGVLTQEIILYESKMECERNLDTKTKLIFAMLESLFGFFVPLTIMVTSYCCLHKMATQGSFKHSRRLTKLVTRIVIVFFIFWAPHHLIKLEEIFAKFSGSDPFLSPIAEIVGCLTLINSCVNPFIYAFSSKSLKQKKELTGNEGSQHLHHIAVNNTSDT